MSRRLPPLKALRAFESAARHLSFTKAAEELFVTQAAISHQVKALEDHLGLPLFRRLNRRLILTEAGQRYLPTLRDAFDAIDQATGRLKKEDDSGALRVTVIPSLAAKWLLPRLMHFRELHPGIDVLVSAADAVVDLERDNFHMGLRYGLGGYQGLRVDRLMGDEVFPVCSPRLLAGDKPLKRPDDLKHHTLLHDDMAKGDIHANDWHSWLKAAGAEGVDSGRGPGFSHSSMVLEAAIGCQGVALGRRSLCSDDLAAGRLVCPFGPVIEAPYAYYAVSTFAAAERSKVRIFRDWLLDEAGRTGAASLPLPSS